MKNSKAFFIVCGVIVLLILLVFAVPWKDLGQASQEMEDNAPPADTSAVEAVVDPIDAAIELADSLGLDSRLRYIDTNETEAFEPPGE